MESSNGMSQGQDTQVSSPGTMATPAPIPAPERVPESVTERTFKQHEVNDIVKRAKYGAVEDFKRLQVEQPQYAREKYGLQPDAAKPDLGSSQSAAYMPQESEVRRLAAEEAQRLRDQWLADAKSKSETEYAQRTVQNFWNKVLPGKEKYQDFEQVVGDIEYARFPNTVQLLAEYVDNADDVLYELGKDRIKMANLEQLAHMSPKDAIVQAKRLAQQIKDNAAAAKVRQPNEPLSQMRPSNTGTDHGVMSVGDFRKKYRV